MNEDQATEIVRVANRMSEAFQSTVTEEERAALDARHASEPETAPSLPGDREEAMLAFTIDALQTLADDMHSVLEQRKERLHREALEVYYKAESRDPEYPHLIGHVEAMRRAHEREYGYPPPARD